MRNIFNISFSRVALLLLFFLIRKKTLVALLSAMLRPLESLNEDFAEYRGSINTQVNSQICYMRGMLNDEFDYFERRIKVRTAEHDIDKLFVWRENLHKPMMVCKRGVDKYKPLMLGREGQIGINNHDFEIVLPKGYELSENEETRMRALVDSHKLASKTYIITHG